MRMKCPDDPAELFEDGVTFCQRHAISLVNAAEESTEEPDLSTEKPAEATGRVGWSLTTCWHCRKPSSREGNSHCLEPDCGRPLTPPAVHVKFDDGEVDLEPEERVELGRLGRYGPIFRGFGNVSRRHALLRVDDGGDAWIEPCRTVNGTFLNGDELPEAVPRLLHTGDVLRLARNAEGTVTLYDRRRSS